MTEPKVDKYLRHNTSVTAALGAMMTNGLRQEDDKLEISLGFGYTVRHSLNKQKQKYVISLIYPYTPRNQLKHKGQCGHLGVYVQEVLVGSKRTANSTVQR